MTTMRCVVVGGGISGLATAFRMKSAFVNAQIDVWEAQPLLGGVMGTRRTEDFVQEIGPDSLVRSKPAGLRLVSDLGLDAELIGTNPDARIGLIAKGSRLLPVPEGLYLLAPGRLTPFLRSPLLSWPGKMRVALDLVIPRRYQPSREESLADFVRRRLGREALARIAQPLVGGIYTADPETLSLKTTLPVFLEAEQHHGSLIRAMKARVDTATASGPRYSLFASLRGGLGELVTRLTSRLESMGVTIHRERRADGLQRVGQGWMITGQQHGKNLSQIANRVVVAGPAWLASGLLANSQPDLAKELSAISYAGVAVASWALPLSSMPPLPMAAGFVVPACEHRQVLAATFVHQKYAGRCPPGWAQIRAFAGGAMRPQDLLLTDQELCRLLLEDLRRFLAFTGEPRLLGIHRWPRSMCQPILGHGERVARIRALQSREPTLGLVGNGYEGVGIGDIAAQAENLVQQWSAQHHHPAP